MTTLIQIQDDTWELLNKAKKKGQSFDDVIKLLLKKDLNADDSKSADGFNGEQSKCK